YDHLLLGGLGDVPRRPLVLDHLRRAVHGRPGAVGDGPGHRAARPPGHAGAAVAWGAAPGVPRPGQAAVRLRDVVGLHLPLAVPDHLVGQPAGGDPLVPAPAPGRLAVA